MENFENKPDQEEPHQTEAPLPVEPGPEFEPVISPIAAAFLGLIGGFILYQLGGGLLTLILFGFDLEAAPVNGLRLLTIAGQILFILLPALLFTKWIYHNISYIIVLKAPKLGELSLYVIGIIVLTPLLQSYLYIQNYFIDQLAKNSETINTLKSLFDSLNELIEKTFGSLLKVNNVPEALLVVVAIAVVPAVCEEVMFRGFIQRSFEQKLKPFTAALITAIFFSLYHFNPYGLLPLMIIGLYLGFAAYKSQSLVIPIILHFINNFTAVMLYIILGDDELISTKVTTQEALGSNVIYFFILLMLFLMIIFSIRRYYINLKTTQV